MKIYFFCFLTSLIWAIDHFLYKLIVQFFPVSAAGLLSRLIVLLLLFLIILFQGKCSLSGFQGFKENFLPFLFIGSFYFLLNFFGLCGFKSSTLINGSILLRSDVLFTILLCFFLLKEKPSSFQWLGVFVMFVGVFLVMNINVVDFKIGYLGDIFFLLSAFFVSANAVIIKGKLSHLSGSTIGFYNTLIGTFYFFLFFLFNKEYAQLKNLFKPIPFLILVLLGVIQVILFLLYYYVLKRLQVWIVRTLLLFISVFGIFFGFLFLKEKIEFIQIIGLLIMLVGAGEIINEERKSGKPSHSDSLI